MPVSTSKQVRNPVNQQVTHLQNGGKDNMLNRWAGFLHLGSRQDKRTVKTLMRLFPTSDRFRQMPYGILGGQSVSLTYSSTRATFHEHGASRWISSAGLVYPH